MVNFLKNLFRRPLNAEEALELSAHNAAKNGRKQYLQVRKELENAIRCAANSGQDSCFIYQYGCRFDAFIFEELNKEFSARGFRLKLDEDSILCFWDTTNKKE